MANTTMTYKKVTLGEYTDALLSESYWQCRGRLVDKDTSAVCALGLIGALCAEKNNISLISFFERHWLVEYLNSYIEQDLFDALLEAYEAYIAAELTNHPQSKIRDFLVISNDRQELTFPEIAERIKDAV